MLVTAGGRRVKIGGKMLQLRKNDALFLVVQGDHFPYSNIIPPSTSYDNAKFEFRTMSGIQNEITINYGDGVIETFVFDSIFDMRPSNTTAYNRHNYLDSNTGKRVVSVKFKFPQLITEFNAVSIPLYDAFPSNILNLSGLKTIYINYSRLTSFPFQLGELQMLENLTLANVGSALSDRFPSPFLNMSLKTLSVASSIDLSDVYTSNFYALCDSNLKNTLERIVIDDCKVTTLPPNFGNLKLNRLVMRNSNLFETLPQEVNDVPELDSLYLDANNNFKYYSSFSNLVNLTLMRVARCSNLTTDLPPDFENCVKFKNYQVGDAYRTQIRMDEFVDKFYDFVVNNASLVVGSSKFRQMVIVTYYNTNSITPSGIYQQPTGFILGSSNGTPASPLEKIWVMVNQYEHTWTY